MHCLGDLAGPELAGRALPAGLHEQEPRVPPGRLHHAGRVVEHREPARAQARSSLSHRVEVQRHIELRWGDGGVGGAGEDCLDRPAVWRAAGQLLHQVPQRRSEWQLEHPRRTSPQMVKTIVPGAPWVPLARSQSGPSARMWGTLAKVSTLLTRVGLSVGGLANRPWMNGRATRGRGGRPSITSSCPVSSPNRYRSGPRMISTGTPPSASASRIFPSARVRA
jgi:hypothetical protein